MATTKKKGPNTKLKYRIWTPAQKHRIYKHAISIRKETEKMLAKKNLSSAAKDNINILRDLACDIMSATTHMPTSTDGKIYIK